MTEIEDLNTFSDEVCAEMAVMAESTELVDPVFEWDPKERLFKFSRRGRKHGQDIHGTWPPKSGFRSTGEAARHYLDLMLLQSKMDG